MTRQMLHRCTADRRGSSLPLTLLFIVLLSIGAIAGLGRMSAERRSTSNIGAEVDAHSTAQAGIAKYLAAATTPPGASLDTTITGLPGGATAVSVRRLRVASGTLPALYVIRAHAIYTTALRYDAKTPSAERSVAQFALWKPGTMAVQAAWTSVTGLDKNGGSGTIAGTDQCGVAPPVAGVAVPTTASDGGAGYDQSGGGSVPSGTPAILQPAANPAGFAAVIPVDWNHILNSGTIQWDNNLTSIAGWPLLFTSWPSIYVNNSSPLSLSALNSGRGLLVVRHNLVLGGGFTWDGVILVGGVLTSNGNQTIQGAVVTGLNVQLGESVANSDVGNGTKTVQYNSCNVTSSLSSLGSLVAMKNARLDNWPGY